MFSKQQILDFSEVIDAFRLVPRILLIAVGFLVWHVVEWFMALKEPSTQQATLVATITGIIPAVIGLYQNSGRFWGTKTRDTPPTQNRDSVGE